MTLADLKPGDQVTIERIATADPTVQRLMVLGLVEGAELTFIRASLGGDPLEFRVFGAAISLRREQARHFHVIPVGVAVGAASTATLAGAKPTRT
jgi:Fe2+ transport system protein FeoA